MTNEENETSLLHSITGGATIFAAGTILQKGLGFALNLGLTWGLGPYLYGFYAYANIVTRLAGIFADLGASKTALRYLPTYNDASEQNVLIGLGILTSLFGSLLVAAGIFVFAPIINQYTFGEPIFEDVLRIFAIVIPFNSLSKFVSNSFRSIEKVTHHVFLKQVLKPGTRLLFVTVALVLGYSLVGTVGATIVAGAVVFGTATVLMAFQAPFQPSFDWSRDDVVTFYDFSIPLALKDVSTFLYNRVDVLMLGFLLPQATSVGVYNIAMLLSSLLALPLSGFNQLFPPIAARLLDDGKGEKLEQIHGILARWTLTVSVLLAACIGIYSTEILGVFGEAFTAGNTVVLFFLFGQLMNSVAFGTGYILLVTDRKYIILANQWTFGILNVVLNYFFIDAFGIAGAAIATASVYVGLNVTRIVELWYLEGLFPYTPRFLKPIFAGLVAGTVMFAVRSDTSGLAIAIAGSAVGTAVFGVVLYLLGIEAEDKEFVLSLLRQSE